MAGDVDALLILHAGLHTGGAFGELQPVTTAHDEDAGGVDARDEAGGSEHGDGAQAM
eukprot:gene20973-25700_t